MRLALKTIVLLAGVGAIVGFIAAPYLLGETDSGRKLYVKANEEIVNRLPVPPGTEEVDHRSAPYYAAKGNAPIAGYRTTVVYRVSALTAQDVIAFYRGQLKRWKTPRGEEACRLACRFVRGTAAVVVDAHTVARARTYSVVADYAGAQS